MAIHLTALPLCLTALLLVAIIVLFVIHPPFYSPQKVLKLRRYRRGEYKDMEVALIQQENTLICPPESKERHI